MLSSTCYFNTRHGFLNLKTVSQQLLSCIFWCISAEALRTFWKGRSRGLPGSRGWGRRPTCTQPAETGAQRGLTTRCGAATTAGCPHCPRGARGCISSHPRPKAHDPCHLPPGTGPAAPAHSRHGRPRLCSPSLSLPRKHTSAGKGPAGDRRGLGADLPHALTCLLHGPQKGQWLTERTA